ADGSHKEKLFVDGGPSTTGTVGHLRMEGREVFKHAVGMITDVIEDVFAKGGITADDLDWFVPHQANRRIIEASAKKLGIDLEKVVITVDQHGNTSAASVPLALGAAVADGRIRKGDLVLLEAMGGGFTWGAVLLRWYEKDRPAPHNTHLVGAGCLPLAATFLNVPKYCAFFNTLQWLDDPMGGTTVTRADLAEAVYRNVRLARTE